MALTIARAPLPIAFHSQACVLCFNTSISYCVLAADTHSNGRGSEANKICRPVFGEYNLETADSQSASSRHRKIHSDDKEITKGAQPNPSILIALFSKQNGLLLVAPNNQPVLIFWQSLTPTSGNCSPRTLLVTPRNTIVLFLYHEKCWI